MSLTIRELADLYQRFDSEPLLKPSQVAALFCVDPKTVSRWATAGKLRSMRTVGGHRRFRESEVREYFNEITGRRAGPIL